MSTNHSEYVWPGRGHLKTGTTQDMSSGYCFLTPRPRHTRRVAKTPGTCAYTAKFGWHEQICLLMQNMRLKLVHLRVWGKWPKLLMEALRVYFVAMVQLQRGGCFLVSSVWEGETMEGNHVGI